MSHKCDILDTHMRERVKGNLHATHTDVLWGNCVRSGGILEWVRIGVECNAMYTARVINT